MMNPVILVAIAAFVGVSALVAGLFLVFRGESSRDIEERLELLTGKVSSGQQKDDKRSILAESLDDKKTVLDQFLEQFGIIGKLVRQADLSIRPTQLCLIGAGLGLAAMVIAAVLRTPVYCWPLAAAGGCCLPLFWVLWRRKRRLKAFTAQLPDAMDMLARALRAGQSLSAGFGLIAKEMPDPIAKEFGRVFEEQNLGVPLEESLRDMTERVPSLDLKFFATAVILQRQTGGDLAEILDKIGGLIRERFQIWGQIQALTGEGRLSGVVLMALPVLLFFAVYYLNPDYIMVLFTDPMGKKMLAGAIIMQIIGAFVIKKIVNIKV